MGTMDGCSLVLLQLLAKMLETVTLCFMLMILLIEANASFEKKLDGQIDTCDFLNDDDKVEKLKTCM